MATILYRARGQDGCPTVPENSHIDDAIPILPDGLVPDSGGTMNVRVWRNTCLSVHADGNAYCEPGLDGFTGTYLPVGGNARGFD